MSAPFESTAPATANEPSDCTAISFSESWAADQVRRWTQDDIALAFVPDIVRNIASEHQPAAIRALELAALNGVIELRVSINPFAKVTREERACCPKSSGGNSLLWARLL